MNPLSLNEVLSRSDLWRGGHFANFADSALPTASTGFNELDAELPGFGWPRGALTELLCDGEGRGETSLLLPGLRELCADDGWLLVVAPPYALQAPAWAQAGIALERTLIVLAPGARSPRQRETDAQCALWAAQQGLASDAPAAIVCWSTTNDARAVHRLQVAAAAGHSAIFLFRPSRVAASASAAPLRLGLASGEEGCLAVRVLKRRGPPLAHPLSLALPRPALGSFHASFLARPLPSPASARRAAAAAHALCG
jgi:cell division inhibitor SulA